jgi:hypothetical protein
LNQFHCCFCFFFFIRADMKRNWYSHTHTVDEIFSFFFRLFKTLWELRLYCACALFLLPRSALALSLASIVSRDSCRFHARGWWTLCLSPLPRLSVVGRLSGAAAVAHRSPPLSLPSLWKPPKKFFY